MATKTKPHTEKVSIFHRFTGAVQFEASVECSPDTLPSVKLGLAVKAALKDGANLSGADLSRADLSRAYLSGAYLSGTDLSGADLSGADLSRANLSGANLSGANLSGGYLSGANLSGADLSRADLSGANLSRANLSGGYLSGAEIERKFLPPFQIPQEGELIVFKKVRGGVCKLLIPADAKRTASVIGRKCRAEFVKVLEAPKDGRGLHDSATVYRVGEIVRPDSYDDDPLVECTHGIHFLLTREEAEAYR